MSRTVSLRWGDRTLWATSRETAIVAAWLVRLVEEEGAADDPWWADLLEHWRVQAAVRDLGLTLEATWPSDRHDEVRDLVRRVRARIATHGDHAAQHLGGWIVLDEVSVDGSAGPHRDDVPVAQILDVADGVLALLEERLPPDPPDGWWLVGASGGRRPLTRRPASG